MKTISRLISSCLAGLAVITLAACTSTMPAQTEQATSVVQGSESITFAQNQAALATISGLDLKGQVGIITAKERSSTTFSYQDYASGDYIVTLNIPYTTKVATVRKNGDYYYYKEGDTTYTSSQQDEFAQALFGFIVPLDLMHKIILAQNVEPVTLNGVANPHVTVVGNILTAQVVNGDTYVSYGDFKLLENKFLVPQSISITRAKDTIRIRMLSPYTYFVDGKVVK
ncbi:lipoprotein insertase outer membrane protein LolB [Psittacicella hinzii]|uniref:Outer-membrane lipoprotein LolB n=1 Tax=Psittacicella hinzii TaxID=2028575 RepID=A0A3A1YM46_9GAMM|nr:lipoprotein insertase outer membrane protein LolB [Psittacicella hinzii]RIY38536.1 hypothetical protein CKF58_04015 [Psittacicella hinzii]